MFFKILPGLLAIAAAAAQAYSVYRDHRAEHKRVAEVDQLRQTLQPAIVHAMGRAMDPLLVTLFGEGRSLNIFSAEPGVLNPDEGLYDAQEVFFGNSYWRASGMELAARRAQLLDGMADIDVAWRLFDSKHAHFDVVQFLDSLQALSDGLRAELLRGVEFIPQDVRLSAEAVLASPWLRDLERRITMNHAGDPSGEASGTLMDVVSQGPEVERAAALFGHLADLARAIAAIDLPADKEQGW